MSDFFIKIENFLFDILGLTLPGAIFLLILLSPNLFFDASTAKPDMIHSSVILSSLTVVTGWIKTYWPLYTTYVLFIGLAGAYLIGHTVKVLSGYMYDILKAVFDSTLNKIAGPLFAGIKNIARRLLNTLIRNPQNRQHTVDWINSFLYPWKKGLQDIFTFGAPSYDGKHQVLWQNCLDTIDRRLDITYPRDWHSTYKISSVMSEQEGVRSIAVFYLAKYNLYRSLAFIFLFATVYYGLFFGETRAQLSPQVNRITLAVLILNIVLWFTFHHKYKRYWTLSGDERLLSLFYFLNKKKWNES